MENCQINFIKANINRPHIIVGESALANNGLIYWSNCLKLWTPYETLDGVKYIGGVLEYYHLIDDKYLTVVDSDLNLYIPTQEKSIIDVILHLDEYYIEGLLIEALQNYIAQHDDLLTLYNVANYYGLSAKELDYWINEAINEDDMSMG